MPASLTDKTQLRLYAIQRSFKTYYRIIFYCRLAGLSSPAVMPAKEYYKQYCCLSRVVNTEYIYQHLELQTHADPCVNVYLGFCVYRVRLWAWQSSVDSPREGSRHGSDTEGSRTGPATPKSSVKPGECYFFTVVCVLFFLCSLTLEKIKI